MTRAKWTPERKKELKKLVKRHKHRNGIIAKKMGATVQQISSQKYFLKNPPLGIENRKVRLFTEPMKTELIELYKEKKSYHEIAQTMGLEKKQVYMKIYHMGY